MTGFPPGCSFFGVSMRPPLRSTSLTPRGYSGFPASARQTPFWAERKTAASSSLAYSFCDERGRRAGAPLFGAVGRLSDSAAGEPYEHRMDRALDAGRP